jgi:hypothetical protein
LKCAFIVADEDLGRKSLYPPIDRHVIDRDPALCAQLLHSHITTFRSDKPYRRYERTATAITSRGKRRPANAEDPSQTVIRTSVLVVAAGQRNTAAEAPTRE